MKFVEFVQGQSVNLDCVTYFQEYNGRTQIFCENGMMLESTLTYAQFKTIVDSGQNQINKRLEQLAKFQTVPTP